MEFFFDSGIFLGLDPQDDYYDLVKKFLRYYKKGKHEYYSARVVRRELNGWKIYVIRKHQYGRREIRFKFDLIYQFFEESVNVLVDYSNHNIFRELYDKFYPITGNDKFDSAIMSNCVIWDFESNDLEYPIFLTLDNGHFCDNEEEIIEIIEGCTSKDEVRLKIHCVWDMVPP